MRVPDAPRTLGSSLLVAPREVDVEVWQAHVIKHPFGLGALYGLPGPSGRSWNAEGWDLLEPPVVDLEERQRIVSVVRALELAGATCAAERLDREDFHGESPNDVPCYDCPRALAARCADTTAPVNARYSAWVHDLLDVLEDAHPVRRSVLCARVMERWRDHAALPVVLSTGLLRSDLGPGARINEPNGVRVELYLDARTLRWRTTYRKPPRALTDRLSHLLQVLPPLPRIPVSGEVLVPRRWWQENMS